MASVLVATAIGAGPSLYCRVGKPKLSPTANARITTAAVCGLTVVLTHPMIPWALSTHPGFWVAFILALILPWATALVLLRSPLLPLAVAVRQ